MAATEISTRANAALDDLYRHHVGEVYRYTYAVLGNHADAEDVTQTTFVNALRALERGESPENASAWLVAIAQNVVRQRWRQAASRPAEVELVHDVPETAHEEDIEVDELVRALQRIPPTQREALVMRELEGRSYNEIAGLLGLTTSALETLLFRARRSLAEELENVVTCQNAELAMSKQLDGRLSRKERRRLDEHLAECSDCARLAEMQKRQRRAFKGLAVLPIPVGLALFKGAPSAAAAASLPTIGLGATGTTSSGAAGATGVGVGGTTSGGAVAGGSLVAAAAKVAAVIVAATLAGGIAYKGAQLAQDDSPSSTTSAPQAKNGTPRAATPRPAPTPPAGKPAQQRAGTVASAPQARTAVAGGVAMESQTGVVHEVGSGHDQADAGAKASGGTSSGAPTASSGDAPAAAPSPSAPPAAKPAPEPRNPKAAPAPKPTPTPPAAKPKPTPPVGPGASNGSGGGTPGPSTPPAQPPTSPGNGGSTPPAENGSSDTAGGGTSQPGGSTSQPGSETGGTTTPPPAPSDPPTPGPSTPDAGCPGGGNGPGNGTGCGIGNAYGQDNGKSKP